MRTSSGDSYTIDGVVDSGQDYWSSGVRMSGNNSFVQKAVNGHDGLETVNTETDLDDKEPLPTNLQVIGFSENKRKPSRN